MRASAIAAAGSVLSQPTRMMTPSRLCPRTASSMESAITSREISEARIPAPPIVMPSDTTMVLKSIGAPPAARTPRRTGSARSPRWRLHGVIVDHVFTTAIIGLAKSSSVRPVARSMARAGARLGPLVIASLRLAGWSVNSGPFLWSGTGPPNEKPPLPGRKRGS